MRDKPVILPELEPFWAAAQNDEFVLPRCRACGRWYWPWSACNGDHNEPFLANIGWRQASGEGTIYTYSISQIQFRPGFDGPYAYGIIELAEGPLMPLRIACRNNLREIRIGSRGRTEFAADNEGWKRPVFNLND